MVRLYPEQREAPLHGALRHLLRHPAHAPSVGVAGRLPQGAVDQFGHPLVVVGARSARTELIAEPLDPQLQKPVGATCRPSSMGTSGARGRPRAMIASCPYL